MMNEYYPRLRRLSIAIDYEIREVRNSEAATLIYTNPKMLNLQEMVRRSKELPAGNERIQGSVRNSRYQLSHRYCGKYQRCLCQHRLR